MFEYESFDKMVGRVAGAIYGDLSRHFPHPPLMLVPAVTFKVRKILEQITDLRLFTADQRAELAKEIQTAIVPMLFSFDIEADTVKKMAPLIESAALRSLMNFQDRGANKVFG